MSLSLRRAPPCPLRRVRVDSTALKTREFMVDGSTTVHALKQSIVEAHCKGVHRWVDEAGKVIQASGPSMHTPRPIEATTHARCSPSPSPSLTQSKYTAQDTQIMCLAPG
jgi:hypothetical protein